MKNISLTINNRVVDAAVEPRLNLADFLRDHRDLTATHIGCEHGVCGACTVLIDGVPARSCITFAVAVDHASVTTLEGFNDDLVMNTLRESFSEHHGLQCGFCTPGMLMTSRDILTRLPDADEKRIRLELAGNLCRCTGYVGIVKAIQAAQTKLKATTLPGSISRRTGPTGAHPSTVRKEGLRTPSPASRTTSTIISEKSSAPIDWAAVEREGTELRQAFTVPFPRADVWRFFADIGQVAQCMPGARITGPMQDGRADGELNVKLGPIVSAFQGAVEVTRDDVGYNGLVRAAGRDALSPSNARALISYAVSAPDAATSRIEVSVRFLLSGALAQFSRGSLIKDVADHITRTFTQNLEARLSGKVTGVSSEATLDAGAVAGSAIWARIRTLAGKLVGR